MPGTVLGSGSITVKKLDKIPCPQGDDNLGGSIHTLLRRTLSGLRDNRCRCLQYLVHSKCSINVSCRYF